MQCPKVSRAHVSPASAERCQPRMYGLSAADEDIQARARAFADELIPFEVAGGARRRPAGRRHRSAQEARHRARRLRHQHAARAGRRRLRRTLQQVLVQEQVGRVTNALGWVAATPPVLVPAGRHARTSSSATCKPDGPRRARGVLRDHRGGRGLRRRRDRGHRPPRRRRLGAQRRQVARHVLQHRRLRLLPGEEDR